MRFSKTQHRARPSQGGKFHPPVVPAIRDQLAAVCAETFPWRSYAEASTHCPLAQKVGENPWVAGPEIPQALIDAWRTYERLVLGPSTIVEVPPPATDYKITWSAAPPVDEELERERARLVGKRVRHTPRMSRASEDVPGVVVNVMRAIVGMPDAGGPVRAFTDKEEGRHALGWLASQCEPIPEEKPRETTFGELEIGEWFACYPPTDRGAYPQRKSSIDVRAAYFPLTGEAVGTFPEDSGRRVWRIDGPKHGG